ncbi:hypothetical protein GCM10029964_103740 [Kibdelosporangium lantanae]
MTDPDLPTIAAATGTELVSQHGGIALFRRADRLFSLVPGGEVTVGYTGADFRPTPEQAESYAESAEEYGLPSIQEHVDAMTSPRRRVRVPTLLVAVDAVDPMRDRRTDYASEVEALAAEGMRLPTPDEWEWACGGGADTLFRWGDDCPSDRYPLDGPGPHDAANRFGLRIGQDPYHDERTSDPGVICGGDGGGMVCGGAGYFLGWLTLATSFRDQHYANWVAENPATSTRCTYGP